MLFLCEHFCLLTYLCNSYIFYVEAKNHKKNKEIKLVLGLLKANEFYALFMYLYRKFTQSIDLLSHEAFLNLD